MIIYQIRLPKKQDAEAFLKFMGEEYFPAVHRGPTRVGQVTDLVLLEEEPESKATGCRFILHVGWEGLPGGGLSVDDEAIMQKFNAFKPGFKRMGSYREVATWHEQNPA